MRLFLLLSLSILVSTSGLFAQNVKVQSVQSPGKMAKIYDGDWWLASALERRSGFLEGVADCQTWVVRAEGFSGTSDQLVEKITRYYKTHPNDRRVLVIDIWRRVGAATSTKPLPNGEVWKEPHWYLNGLWWRQVSESERLGFLEGYLWCLRTQVNRPENAYSRSLSFYVDEIDEYVRAYPKADDESVATILERFRDGSKRQ
ncbi:MAG: hypothetical protein LLG20_20945 [Acidobacteriales bacterium]|nr:hypothetical protein [Terriglobales bacterium]